MPTPTTTSGAASGTGTTVVTGAASGLGAAIVRRRRAAGEPTIGIDWTASTGGAEVDVLADLSTPGGRDAAVQAARDVGVPIVGVVSCAGLSPVHSDPAQIVAVNWFGAMAILDGLRDTMAGVPGASAVAISSIGAAIGGDDELEALLFAGDEAAATAAATDGITAYSTCKRALAKAVRRRAATWGADGIRLNAIAPGRMETPMLDGLLADPDVAPGIDALPAGVARSASADLIAGVVTFLLGPDAAFVHGQVIYVDGGSEAILRPDLV